MKKNRTKLRNKLDAQWSLVIRQKGRCEYCGKDSYLNAHHFYSRSALSTRWVLENGFCLCSGHHTLSSTFSAHKTPANFVEWAIETRGLDWYANLKKRHNTITILSDFELEMTLEKLRLMQNG